MVSLFRPEVVHAQRLRQAGGPLVTGSASLAGPTGALVALIVAVFVAGWPVERALRVDARILRIEPAVDAGGLRWRVLIAGARPGLIAPGRRGQVIADRGGSPPDRVDAEVVGSSAAPADANGTVVELVVRGGGEAAQAGGVARLDFPLGRRPLLGWMLRRSGEATADPGGML